MPTWPVYPCDTVVPNEAVGLYPYVYVADVFRPNFINNFISICWKHLIWVLAKMG